MRSFQIHLPVGLPGGAKLSRGVLKTDDKKLIRALLKCAAGTFTEIECEAPKENTASAPAEPVAAQKKEIAPEVPAAKTETKTEAEPDWAYMLVKDLCLFIDSSGHGLPDGRVKAELEFVAKQVWDTGLRPHPLYGLPGGRTPAAGLPGPNALEVEVIMAAIELCEEQGIAVPQETWDAAEAIQEKAVAEAALEALGGEAPIEPESIKVPIKLSKFGEAFSKALDESNEHPKTAETVAGEVEVTIASVEVDGHGLPEISEAATDKDLREWVDGDTKESESAKGEARWETDEEAAAAQARLDESKPSVAEAGDQAETTDLFQEE